MATKSLDLPSAVVGKNAKPTPFLDYLKLNGVTDVTTAPIRTLKMVLDAYNHFVYKKLVDWACDQAAKDPKSIYAYSFDGNGFQLYEEWLEKVYDNLPTIESGIAPTHFWQPEIDYLMSPHYVMALNIVDDEENRYKYTGQQIRAGLDNVADKIESHGNKVGSCIAYAGSRIGGAIEHAGRDISGRNPY